MELCSTYFLANKFYFQTSTTSVLFDIYLFINCYYLVLFDTYFLIFVVRIRLLIIFDQLSRK
jgi:hypothetical protein